MKNNTSFIILTLLIGVLCGVALYFYPEVGVVLTGCLLLLILIKLIRDRRMQNEVMSGIDRIYRRFNDLNQHQMNQLPLAFVITDKDGRIVWYNDAFTASFYPQSDGKPDITGKKIGEELNLNLEECLKDPDFEYSNRNIDYSVAVQDLKDSRGDLHIINFFI